MQGLEEASYKKRDLFKIVFGDLQGIGHIGVFFCFGGVGLQGFVVGDATLCQ